MYDITPLNQVGIWSDFCTQVKAVHHKQLTILSSQPQLCYLQLEQGQTSLKHHVP